MEGTTSTTTKTTTATATLLSNKPSYSSQEYLSEPRIQVFWWSFLAIYLCFQSFSCGRADRLWRISDVYDATPRVLLKPYGISFLWYESLAQYMATVEILVLIAMVTLSLLPLALPFLSDNKNQQQEETTDPNKWTLQCVLLPARRWLAFSCGLGWLYLHAYEHSLTGGSHTHLMPAICMMALALPPQQSIHIIQQWNVFLLFSAGASKLFNGSHHPWWAWMDGQSMQFYFENSRQTVPEPFYTWTMPPNVWFAVAQCTMSTIFELSTFLVLVSTSYRLAFPFLGAMFHGMIWYTLGVNYLLSVVIQFTLVLDQEDWRCICGQAFKVWNLCVGRSETVACDDKLGDENINQKSCNSNILKQTNVKTAILSTAPCSPKWLLIPIVNALVLIVVIVQQMEFWPLSNIPMYSGYRPHVGYNTTHIANRTYLDHLILETAPHVWSRH
ncbi:hypothetical protein ACA910_001531 [Epithemia clementina (nom. ined.)]